MPGALQRSVELAPLSASAAESMPGSLTHDAYWRLSPDQRLSRERELGELRSPRDDARAGTHILRQYEAQQPSLYYILMAPIYFLFKDASVPAQVLALRFASLLMAAAGIWLCYELGFEVPAARRSAIAILLLLASWPGFLIDVSRIGNDVLAFTLGSAYILCLFRIVCGDSELRRWMLAGIALGACLLTKSYMLTLVLLLPVAALIEARRGRPRSAWRGLLVAAAVAGLMAGWWYVGAYRATGTLSGEQIAAAAAHFGLLGRLRAAMGVHWLRVLDSAAATHIWVGGWSFLTVRSWMYRVFEWVAMIAGVGLVALTVRRCRKAYRRGTRVGDARLLLAGCAYLLFCSALAYFAIVVYLTRGISTTLGWYLYPVAGVEAVLLACGFSGLVGTRRAAGCVSVVAALACVLDLYTIDFVCVPYYAGLTAHPLVTLRDAGFAGIFARMAVNKPLAPAVLAALWVGYLCATFGLLAYSTAIVRQAFFSKSESGQRRGLRHRTPAKL